MVPALALGAVHELSLQDAVRLAGRQSPTARKLVLESHRSGLTYRGARRSAWPDLALDLQAPILGQEFSVEPLPSSSVDTRLVYGKTTTRRQNASGDLRFQQLLPWRGALSATSSLYYRDERTSPAGVRQARNDYLLATQIGLDLRLLGDDPARRQLRRADVEWDMARARDRMARAQLEFDTVSQYLALLRARLSLDIVRAAAAEAGRALDLARRKVNTGLLPEVELLRMGVHRAESEARLAEAETDLARATDGFKIFLGLVPADSLVLSEALASFELHVPVQDAVRRALEQRSEVGLAQRDLELLEMDRKARRPHIPDVSLALRYGGAASEVALDRTVESLSANNLSFLLSFHVPLWDSGRLAFDEESVRAGIQLREIEVEEMRRRIELEVRDAARQLGDAWRRWQLFEASTHLAEESLRISGERYERGLIDTSTYLNSQADAATARLGRTAALLDLYQARARLRLVTMSGEW